MKYFIYILIFLLTTNTALAGSLTLQQKNSGPANQKVGDELLLEINFQTELESYNAVSGTLSVDPSFEIIQIITRNSVISAWIENPSKSKTNTISFAGIIAGGLQGSGTLFELVIVPKEAGVFPVELKNISIFKNNGLGTEETLNTQDKEIPVRSLLPGEVPSKLTWTDTTPPEQFDALLVKDPTIANNKYVLVFEAIDKGSGIRSYSVLEGKKLFEQAESPYILKNQKINEKIYVKAKDYYGNERVVRVDIPNSACFGAQCVNQKILIVTLALIFVLFLVIWRKQSKEFRKIKERVS